MCYKTGSVKDKTYDNDFHYEVAFLMNGCNFKQTSSGFNITGSKNTIKVNVFAFYRCMNSCTYMLLPEADKYNWQSGPITVEEVAELANKKIKKSKKEHDIKSKKLRNLYQYFEGFDSPLEDYTIQAIMDLIKEADEGIL